MVTLPSKLKLIVASGIAVLLTGCLGFGADSDDAADTPAVIDDTAIEAVTEIETVSGTPAEQVEDYTEKAREAQIKLQLLLEKQEAEAAGEQSSFLHFQLVPTAFAAEEGDEDEVTEADEVADLLAEIEIYTELALEAATAETDPEVVAELLEVVQETQTETVELIEEASSDASDEVAEILNDVAEEISESITEVDEAAAEVAAAIDSGATEVVIDVETDVEDFLAEGARKISIREHRNPKARAERKLRRAERELERVRERLVTDGVPATEAAAALAEFQTRVAEAAGFIENGEFGQAIAAARASKRGVKKIQNTLHRVRDAKARFDELKELADSGDAVAAERLEKITPLIREGKLHEVLAERREVNREFHEQAKVKRAEFKADRKEAREEFLEFKRDEATGEIAPEEFREKKEAFFKFQRDLKNERNAAEREIRAERLEKLGELKGLSTEAIEAKKAELAERAVERRQAISEKQKALHEERRQKIQEKREEVRENIEEKREETQANREEKREDVRENRTEKREQIQTKRVEVQDKREEIKDRREEVQEKREEILDNRQKREKRR